MATAYSFVSGNSNHMCNCHTDDYLSDYDALYENNGVVLACVFSFLPNEAEKSERKKEIDEIKAEIEKLKERLEKMEVKDASCN